MNRQRFKQTEALKDRLSAFADELREQAAQAPSKSAKDDLLKRAQRAASAAAQLDDFFKSSGSPTK